MGYDQLEDILDLPTQDFEIMCEIIECKPGHVMKLRRELTKLKSVNIFHHFMLTSHCFHTDHTEHTSKIHQNPNGETENPNDEIDT